MKDLTLYVVESRLWCFPKLTVFRLKEERKTCYLVDHGVGSRVLMKGTIGRTYFTDRDKLIAHLRKEAARLRDHARNTMLRMEVVMDAEDADVLDFHREFDGITDKIEQQVIAKGRL